MGLYFPPRPCVAREKAHYRSTVDKLAAWAEDTLRGIRTQAGRTMIIVGMDLNDELKGDGEGYAAERMR
eukprot:3631516-Lingulodinium_polyedra.AAC.1